MTSKFGCNQKMRTNLRTLDSKKLYQYPYFENNFSRQFIGHIYQKNECLWGTELELCSNNKGPGYILTEKFGYSRWKEIIDCLNWQLFFAIIKLLNYQVIRQATQHYRILLQREQCPEIIIWIPTGSFIFTIMWGIWKRSSL